MFEPTSQGEFEAIFQSPMYRSISLLKDQFDNGDHLKPYFDIKSAVLNHLEGEELLDFQRRIAEPLHTLVDISSHLDGENSIEIYEAVLDLVKEAKDASLLDLETQSKISMTVSTMLIEYSKITGIDGKSFLSRCATKFELGLKKGLVFEVDRTAFEEIMEERLSACFNYSQATRIVSGSSEIIDIEFINQLVDSIKAGLLTGKVLDEVLINTASVVLKNSVSFVDYVSFFIELKGLTISTPVKRAFYQSLKDGITQGVSYLTLGDIAKATAEAALIGLLTINNTTEIRLTIKQKFIDVYFPTVQKSGTKQDLALVKRAYDEIFYSPIFGEYDRLALQTLMVDAVINLVQRRKP